MKKQAIVILAIVLLALALPARAGQPARELQVPNGGGGLGVGNVITKEE